MKQTTTATTGSSASGTIKFSGQKPTFGANRGNKQSLVVKSEFPELGDEIVKKEDKKQ